VLPSCRHPPGRASSSSRQDHQQHSQQALAATGLLLLLEAQHKQELQKLLAVGEGMACQMMTMICWQTWILTTLRRSSGAHRHPLLLHMGNSSSSGSRAGSSSSGSSRALALAAGSSSSSHLSSTAGQKAYLGRAAAAAMLAALLPLQQVQEQGQAVGHMALAWAQQEEQQQLQEDQGLAGSNSSSMVQGAGMALVAEEEVPHRDSQGPTAWAAAMQQQEAAGMAVLAAAALAAMSATLAAAGLGRRGCRSGMQGAWARCGRPTLHSEHQHQVRVRCLMPCQCVQLLWG
jgi:hypothetical protein